jgi:hypothetical protein
MTLPTAREGHATSGHPTTPPPTVGRSLPLDGGQTWPERLDAGDAVVDVARTFGVDRATLYRMRAEAAP